MRLNHLNTISVSSRFVEIILVVISPWESFYTIGALCVSPHRYNTVSISNSVLIIPIWRGFFGIDAICVLTTAIQYRFHPDLLIYSSTWYQICYMRTVMCFNHIMPMPHSYFFFETNHFLMPIFTLRCYLCFNYITTRWDHVDTILLVSRNNVGFSQWVLFTTLNSVYNISILESFYMLVWPITVSGLRCKEKHVKRNYGHTSM